MIKKILLFALMLIPVYAFAQESQKIAHLFTSEVLLAMPEFTQMNDSLQKQAAIFDGEMKMLQEDYQKKYETYLEQRDSLTESIRMRREQELTDLGEKAMTFQQEARSAQEQLQEALITPIREKIVKAVQEVAAENKYAYVIEIQYLLYVSPESVNATPLVKTKLGIK